MKLAKSPDEAFEHASKILGMQLVTHQTGPEGQKVQKVLIEEAAAIARELYVAVTLDRAVGQAGGHRLGERAAWTSRRSRTTDPDAIHREPFDPFLGLLPFQARRIARRLGLAGDTASRAAQAGHGALPGLRRDRRLARRDQPADDHRRRATSSRSTPR